MARIFQLSDFWSGASTVYNVIRMDVTDTLSADASTVLWLGIGGTVVFEVRKNGLALSSSAAHLKLPSGSLASLALAWGDGDTGFYESSPDVMQSAHAGVATFEWTSTQFGGLIPGAGVIMAVAASATVPGFAFVGDTDTGIGRRAVDVGVLIAGGKNCLEFGEIAAAPALGFFGNAAIVKPTSVLLNGNDIVAALVSLGIFRAA